MSHDFSFAFEDGEQPGSLILEARRSIDAAYGPLSPNAPTAQSEAQKAADRLLTELQSNVAEFSNAQPHLQPLTRESFALQNAIMTPDVAQLFTTHKLYWLRVPYTLQAKSDHRFERVELVIELNPGADALERPRVEAALPQNEFTNLTTTVVELSLGIDESLHFSAKVGSPPLPRTPVSEPGDTMPTGGGAATGDQTGKVSFVAGPFTYRVRRALIERSPLGTEKVFWRISSEEKLEDPPELVAVIAVPVGTARLQISAALQAYSSPQVLQMTLGNFFRFLGNRLRTFFVAGAPTRDVQVWDLSKTL